ncbi:hypothetical protein CJD44_24170 [Streptomyces sp. alain-838]|nr:hypothetical protein [Streptomyces sp. alain-838]PAK24166.1 hypothetical protein CJD44_24170 [Streptomyces sp. alain-838]
MKLSVGQTLSSAVDGTTVVVVRCPDHEVALTCGGHEMRPQGEQPASTEASLVGTPGDGLVIGKRYADEEAALEVLCVRPGQYPVHVDGTALSQKGAQPLPASD